MIPCKNCLKLPICRHKKYERFVNDCLDVAIYLVTPFDATVGRDSALRRLEPVVNSTKWYSDRSQTETLAKVHGYYTPLSATSGKLGVKSK